MDRIVDFSNDFLKKQLITYIGNKRKLLPLIVKSVSTYFPNCDQGLRFADVFAGSGVVSRLAKYIGFKVYTNDWENYSYILNKSFIGLNRRDLDRLFKDENGIEAVLEYFNNLPNPKIGDEYITKYYSPKSYDIDDADYKSERLFYTKENGQIIDRIRNKIDEKYPESSKDRDVLKKRDLLISLLVYEASIHTNTSGVFKACHKGFGGHNRDALKRILEPIKLKIPFLIDSKFKNSIYKMDAKDFVKLKDIQNLDIAYLDPPYNQHQYGSNYHLLNTIVNWDKIPVPLQKDKNGKIAEKAGIRKDWVKTKSNFCYKDKAVEDFKDLLENIKAKIILISYSTDGIIPFDDMLKICSDKGKIDIITNEYSKFKGGKQSNSCEVKNIEFIIAIDTAKKSCSNDFLKIYQTIEINKINLIFDKIFSMRKLEKNFNVLPNKISTTIMNQYIEFEREKILKLKRVDNLEIYSLLFLRKLKDKFNQSLCKTKEEEIEELLFYIINKNDISDFYVKQLPQYLKKLVNKKNVDIYYRLLTKIKNLKFKNNKLYDSIDLKIRDIELLAEKRFAG